MTDRSGPRLGLRRLARAPALGRGGRAAREPHRHRRGPSPGLRPRPRRVGRTGWRTSARFAADHRVVAVDLPGFGDSEMPEEEITIPGYGRVARPPVRRSGHRARGRRRQLDGRLHRRGGRDQDPPPRRAPRARLRRGGLAPRAARAGAAAGHRGDGEHRPDRHRVGAVARALVHQAPAGPADPDLVRRRAPREAPRAADRRAGQGRRQAGLLPGARRAGRLPVRDRLDDISCPTLIVWGSEDILVPLRDAKEFDRLVPDSRLVVYDDTGHMPMLERPERFNEDLRAFLAEQPDERGRAGGGGGAERLARPASPAGP